LEIDVFPELRYHRRVKNLSLCCLKPFLVLLVGAGMPGGWSVPALAGDKIEFYSTSSEDLQMPTAERSDAEQMDLFSGFPFNKAGSISGTPYPMMTSSAGAPARRNNERNFWGEKPRNDTGGLGLDADRQDQNSPFGDSRWGERATNSPSKPATNDLLNSLGAWRNSDNANDLGRDLRQPDLRSGQPHARSDSLNPSAKRDSQNDLGSGSGGLRPWAADKEDASSFSIKKSGADQLKSQNRSLFSDNPGLFNPASRLSSLRTLSAWQTSPLMPSVSPFLSPLNAAEPANNGFKETPARSSSLGSGRYSGSQDPGAAGLPALRAWDEVPGLASPASQPAASRKPAGSASPPATQQQQSGNAMNLSRPKMPSPFN
jgi:hypothetical protein